MNDLKSSSKHLETKLLKEVYLIKLLIADLRHLILESEEDLEYRQQKYRREIDTLQSRLESSEARNEEMIMMNNDATKPLLRQIESMRTQQINSTQDWDQLEEGFRVRFKDLEREKIHAMELNSSLQLKISELTNRVTALEAQNSNERQEKTRLLILIDVIDI